MEHSCEHQCMNNSMEFHAEGIDASKLRAHLAALVFSCARLLLMLQARHSDNFVQCAVCNSMHVPQPDVIEHSDFIANFRGVFSHDEGVDDTACAHRPARQL